MTELSSSDHFLSDLLQKSQLPNLGEPHKFLKKYKTTPSLQQGPQAQKIYQALIANSSVCSFCGVGFPYTKIQNKKGVERLIPLSLLKLCEKY